MKKSITGRKFLFIKKISYIDEKSIFDQIKNIYILITVNVNIVAKCYGT